MWTNHHYVPSYAPKDFFLSQEKLCSLDGKLKLTSEDTTSRSLLGQYVSWSSFCTYKKIKNVDTVTQTVSESQCDIEFFTVILYFLFQIKSPPYTDVFLLLVNQNSSSTPAYPAAATC